jgi:hypothetical protein
VESRADDAADEHTRGDGVVPASYTQSRPRSFAASSDTIASEAGHGEDVRSHHELPDLEEEDARQALVYAAALAQDEVHPLRA